MLLARQILGELTEKPFSNRFTVVKLLREPILGTRAAADVPQKKKKSISRCTMQSSTGAIEKLTMPRDVTTNDVDARKRPLNRCAKQAGQVHSVLMWPWMDKDAPL